MHRALGILEIVSNIVDSTDDKSVVSCTRVCKLWSDVALDEIWHTIEQPDHLLAISCPQMLPLDTDFGNIPEKDEWFRRVDHDNPKDWDRFLFYAKRVKKFNMMDYVRIREWDQMAIFARLCPFPFVLPNLRTLIFQVGPDEGHCTTYLARYFPPTLTDVTLWLDVEVFWGKEEDLELESTLQEIASCSPNITDLSLCGNATIAMKSMERGIVRLLAGLHRTTRLLIHTASVTPATLAAIARMPLLAYLDVDGTFESEERDGSSTSATGPTIPHRSDLPGPTFPSLVEVELDTCNSFITSCLQSKGLPEGLEILSIFLHDQMSERDMRSLLGTVASNYRELRKMHVDWPNTISQAMATLPDVNPDSASLLGVLYGQRNLTSLEFIRCPSNQVVDEEILRFVQHCPQLEELRITPNDPTLERIETMTRLSLNVLLLLSNEPNKLRSLTLCVHVATAGEVPAADAVGDHLKNLRRISLPYSSIGLGLEDDASVQSIGTFIKQCLSRDCICEGAEGDASDIFLSQVQFERS